METDPQQDTINGGTPPLRKRKKSTSPLPPPKFPVPSPSNSDESDPFRDDDESPPVIPDSTQVDPDPFETTPHPSEISVTASNDPRLSGESSLKDFRRFSERSKKQTSFFCPKPVEGSKSIPRDLMPVKPRRKSVQNVRRALNFPVLFPTANFTSSLPSSEAATAAVTGGQDQSELLDEVREVAKETVAFGRREKTVSRDPQPQERVTKATSGPPSVSVEEKFPIGSLVWGKLPGYEWWPGFVISFDKKNLNDAEKDSDEYEEEEGEGGDCDKVAWVKWFGDNQLSQLSCNKMQHFADFVKYFSAAKMKGLYKKAVFCALKEAAKRCSKEFGNKPEDRKPSWTFHPPLLASYLKEKEKTFEARPMDDQQQEQSPIRSPDSSSVLPSVPHPVKESLFVAIVPEPDGGEKGKGKGRAGQFILSMAEKDLLEWGLTGFLPTGPNGFDPRPEHLVEIKVLPIGGASGSDSQSVGKKSDDNASATGSSHGGDEKKSDEKLMLLHMRSRAQFELVKQGQLDIEDICLSCGKVNVAAPHPLFNGGLCKSCKETFMECTYLFDEDGTQMYCTICSGGSQVFMCDTPNCSKVYCSPCIEKLCGSDEWLKVQAATNWQCYMCSEETVGLLQKRADWDKRLHDLFLTDNEMEYEPPKFFPIIPADKRKPLRVLGLFDGIGTGLLVLKELGINVEVYVSSEIDPDAIKVSRVQHPEIIHVGAIEYITEKEVRSWGPFDLVIGGSPCNDLSIVNPARKGIYDGTGKLFFEFFRILSYAKPHPDEQRPFFWFYENVVSMRAPDKKTISRFLQCNPVVVDARDISPAHRARFFWGNIPGMNRPTVPLPGDRLTLQDCLEPHCFRHAQFHKLRTITTKMNSIKQTKKAIYPVRVTNGVFEEMGEEENEDVLWCTEMERLFGFPDHYTDYANLGRSGRQKLLGKAWSVPVVRHILSPLKDYFQSSTTGVPSSIKFGSTQVGTSCPVSMVTSAPSPTSVPSTCTMASVVTPPKSLSPELGDTVVTMVMDTQMTNSSP